MFGDIFKEIYLGVTSNLELDLLKDIDLPKIYFKEILCLNKGDMEILKYLHLLRDNKTILDNYSFNEDVFYNDKVDIDEECLLNIDKIVDSCQIIFPKYELNLPNYVNYNDTKGLSSDEYLYNLSIIGLNKRLDNKITEKYKERLLYELDIIKKMGFSNYFLIVYDYIKYAKNKGILVGPGRGSGASSLVSYSLGIVDVDPLKYDLLFERFLNIERITMPDIDTDFPDNRRDEVIKYVVDKYGLNQVSLIVTFGTFGSKMALRDIGRVMNIPLYLIDEICKIIGNSHDTLTSLYENNSRLKGLIDSDNRLKKLISMAKRIEGNVRHTSIHAAGIIMSDNDLDNLVPLTYNDNMYVCDYEAGYLEELGLLKMDFLGLRNLNTIDNTLKLIKENEHQALFFNEISLDDNKTNELFANGDTLGIFQFESAGMQKFLMDLQPTCFMDIVNANAFFRPGPSDSISTYIRRLHGLEPIDYFDDRLKDILKSTCGIIVYQEQIMQIANVMAGYSLGEADILRRAMSKKKQDVLVLEKDKFIKGSLKNNYSFELANQIFSLILNFAAYGFNKSHSVAYSMISYKMGYLKAHYAIYFYVSLLNSVTMDTLKTNNYLQEIKKNNIKVLKPDINISTNEYTIYNKKILLPFTLISGISSVMAKKIMDIRTTSFIDIYDFFHKTIMGGLTQNTIESLIDSGCLDSLDYNRQTLYHNIDSLMNYGSLTKELDVTYVLKPEIEIVDEFSKDILISKEKEIYGFYITNHPVSLCKAKNKDIVNLQDISQYFNRNITTIGIIDKYKEIMTKKGDKMCFMTLSDEMASCEYILFPKVYNLYENFKKGDIIKVVGKVEKKTNYQIIVQSMEKVEV